MTPELPATVVTARLVLRPWREEDLAPFAELNADPVVMAHFPSTLSRSQSDALVERIEEARRRDGFGLWAVEVPGAVPFAGFVGLSRVLFPAHFTPAVEDGWRLARDHWGRGYATEGARAALDMAFGPLRLDQVVSFTSSGNRRSRRVMERLGMVHDPADDFEHPGLPAGHRLRPHVLYHLDRPAWPGRTGCDQP